MRPRSIEWLTVAADARMEWNQIGPISVYICRERAESAVGRRGWRGGLTPWHLKLG